MAKGLTMEVIGYKGAILNLKTFGAKKTKQVSNAVKACVFDIVEEAQQKAPVDLAYLRQNIRVGTVTELEAEGRSDAEYSAYVEFGTGGLVDVPTGLEGYAMQFKGKGIRQINLAPRPFFFPAAFKHFKLLMEKIK